MVGCVPFLVQDLVGAANHRWPCGHVIPRPGLSPPFRFGPPQFSALLGMGCCTWLSVEDKQRESINFKMSVKDCFEG